MNLSISALYLLKHFNRKPQLTLCGLMQGLLMILIGLGISLRNNNLIPSAFEPILPYVLGLLLLLTAFFYSIGVGPIGYAINVEIAPVCVKGLSTSGALGFR